MSRRVSPNFFRRDGGVVHPSHSGEKQGIGSGVAGHTAQFSTRAGFTLRVSAGHWGYQASVLSWSMRSSGEIVRFAPDLSDPISTSRMPRPSRNVAYPGEGRFFLFSPSDDALLRQTLEDRWPEGKIAENMIGRLTK